MSDSATATELEHARGAARRLLKMLKIRKTVVVDDQAVPGPENLLAAFGSNRDNAPLSNDIAWDELDDDAWREQVRSYFDELDSDAKRKLNRRALKTLGTKSGGERDLDLLQQLLGPDQTTMLLPEEWEAKKEQLTAADGAPESLLVLFDRNFGPGLPDGGVSLLRDYLVSHPGARAALLTDTLKPEQELSEVELVTRDAPEIRDRTLLASKENLTPAGAMEFLNVMRLTANVPTLIKVKERFLDAMNRHHATANKQFAKLQPRILEDIVFRSSHTEGAWELDTLLRLITLFQEEAMRQCVPGESGADEIPALLALTRALIDPAYPEYEPSTSKARRIMAAERWTPSEYINRLGLPLANGDVFEIAERHYILMCQPCDLVLRPDGRRKASSTVTLLPLQARAASPEEAPSALSNQRRYHDLPRGFEHEPAEGYAAVFAPWYDVDVTVLDLCTFRSDGTAVMDLSEDEATIPVALTKGIGARRKEVSATVKSRLELAAACGALDAPRQVRRELLRGDRADLLLPDLTRLSDQRLAYRCKRVGRLAPPFADAALTALASERAREAHEHDLDRFGNPAASSSAQSKV